MTKFVLSFIPILIFFKEPVNCITYNSQKQLFQSKKNANDNRFEIVKIDSIKNVYLIYAKRYDSLIKIVSAKERVSNCEKIVIGGKYELNIISIVYQIASKRHIAGVKFNDTIIKMEGGSVIWDLFKSDNLKGLCILPPN